MSKRKRTGRLSPSALGESGELKDFDDTEALRRLQNYFILAVLSDCQCDWCTAIRKLYRQIIRKRLEAELKEG